MALKVVHLASLETPSSQMSYNEYKKELAKPRGERRGLQPMPSDMCMSPSNEIRFVAMCQAHHQKVAASSAHAYASGRNSNCY